MEEGTRASQGTAPFPVTPFATYGENFVVVSGWGMFLPSVIVIAVKEGTRGCPVLGCWSVRARWILVSEG